MTMCEVGPSMFVKIRCDQNDCVVEWLIAKIWTDDVRYFGTDKMRKDYEDALSSNIKVKFLGIPREFVGTEFLQDVSRGLCELKAPEYWMQASDRFSYLFKDGLKVRLNVLSISDEKVLSEGG